jgi:hypothetical protein
MDGLWVDATMRVPGRWRGASGADQRLTVALAQGGPGLQTLAWSPDSQWLLAVAAHGKLVAINADTGHIQGVGIPLPPISQIAIRGSPH